MKLPFVIFLERMNRTSISSFSALVRMVILPLFFPEHLCLMNRCAAKEVVVEDAVAGVSDRITLTATLINKARQILFLVTGKEKSHVFLKPSLQDHIYLKNTPAQLTNPVDGEVYWFVDEKAIVGLKGDEGN